MIAGGCICCAPSCEYLAPLATLRYLLPVHRIPLFELLENPYFDLARVAVLGDGADDFDSYSSIGFCIDSFDNFTKGSLPQKSDSTIFKDKNETLSINIQRV